MHALAALERPRVYSVLSAATRTHLAHVQKDVNMSLLEFEQVIVSAYAKAEGGGENGGTTPPAEADAPDVPPGLIDSAAFPAMTADAQAA